MPTIDDVARAAGVSISTVSYALSGKRAITEETRQRVLAAAAQLGYAPKAAARALAVLDRDRRRGVAARCRRVLPQRREQWLRVCRRVPAPDRGRGP